MSRYATNARRESLLNGFLEALRSLKAAGCGTAYLDGSFITAKEYPGDFDACWEVTGVEAAPLHPELLQFDNARAAQKARYGGELFPAEASADGYGTSYLDFFQRDREGEPKGIIAIDLGGLS